MSKSQQVNIKKILHNLIERENELLYELKQVKNIFLKNEDTTYTIPKLFDLIEKYKNHPLLLNILVTHIMLSWDEKITSQVDLKQIEEIYKLNISTNEYDISFYEDLASHLFLEEEYEEAQKVAEQGINQAKDKVKNLKKLIRDIQKERKLDNQPIERETFTKQLM